MDSGGIISGFFMLEFTGKQVTGQILRDADFGNDILEHRQKQRYEAQQHQFCQVPPPILLFILLSTLKGKRLIERERERKRESAEE
jgi:hypothetical protein